MSNLERSNSTKRYKVWLLQAEYDCKAAKTSYDNGHFEWACYQSVQSVEKVLKAVIVHAGFRPPQTHKLGILVGMSNRANNLFVSIKLPFRKIEAYTFIARYPFVLPGENKTPHEVITKEDARTCVLIAEDIFSKVKAFLENTKAIDSNKNIEKGDYYYSEQEVDKRIAEVTQKLSTAPDMDISKVILYGGFARDKTRPKSTTMDMLIIAKTDMPFIKRIEYIRELTKGNYPIIEPIVYTPEEFQYMTDEEGEGYLESALDEGKLLFEK